MIDHCRWTDSENSTSISDTGTIHGHIDYEFASTGLIGAVDKFKLKALFAVMTQETLYT